MTETAKVIYLDDYRHERKMLRVAYQIGMIDEGIFPSGAADSSKYLGYGKFPERTFFDFWDDQPPA